jgi:hypothetical protein
MHAFLLKLSKTGHIIPPAADDDDDSLPSPRPLHAGLPAEVLSAFLSSHRNSAADDVSPLATTSLSTVSDECSSPAAAGCLNLDLHTGTLEQSQQAWP